MRLIHTQDITWMVPTRILIGVFLVFPVGGRLDHLVTDEIPAFLLMPVCYLKLACALMLILGLAVRLAIIRSYLQASCA